MGTNNLLSNVGCHAELCQTGLQFFGVNEAEEDQRDTHWHRQDKSTRVRPGQGPS